MSDNPFFHMGSMLCQQSIDKSESDKTIEELTAQNKLLAEEVARLKEFIGLETAYDVNDPAMNAARYDGYLDGVQVGIATQITGENHE